MYLPHGKVCLVLLCINIYLWQHSRCTGVNRRPLKSRSEENYFENNFEMLHNR